MGIILVFKKNGYDLSELMLKGASIEIPKSMIEEFRHIPTANGELGQRW